MKFLAGVLDFLIAFLGFGYVIGLISGGASGGGFSLSGIWFVIWVVGVILYFVLAKKFLGQSVGRTILGITSGKK